MGCKGLKLLFILVLSTALIAELKAYQFNVGGKKGWVVSPSENYNHWAERMRFQVNDTLLFRYKKGTDSVLVVNQADYDTCNTKKPITTLDGGESIFKFDRSGPFFFISGTQANCDKGQKLIIVVMAVRNKPPPAPVAISPAPASETGYVSPASTPESSGPASGPKSPLTPTIPSPASSPGGTSGSATSPPRRSAGEVVTPSVILISAVTFVLSFIA